MVQGGSGAGFTAETLERLWVVSDIVGKELQGDEAAERGVLGAVDDTIPPPPNLSRIR